MNRRGDWIKTYTGIKFYPLDPVIEEISIVDISHALSCLCRFTGHCNQFYSVAQHSVICSYAIQEIQECKNNESALVAVLHDASEAYISDISRPMKRSRIFDKYKKIEKVLQLLIYEKFGISEDKYYKYEEYLKYIDNKVLYTEGRDLMTGGTSDWHDAENITPLAGIISPLLPMEAEQLFNKRFKEIIK